MLEPILKAYSIDPDSSRLEQISSGLINKTWKATSRKGTFILQNINTHVFKNPLKLSENLFLLGSFLKVVHPDYLFVAPLPNRLGETLVQYKDHYYRLFPYIENSFTIDQVTKAEEAYEASLQFGKFTTMLKDFPISTLNITLPDFHNLSLRYQQFQKAALNASQERLRLATDVINELNTFTKFVEEYKRISKNQRFVKRVTHHDTKISNVLFNGHGAGMCVIDLDTVMPGYYISDVGDMLRTYLSPTTEEETDLTKIHIRDDIFRAVVAGYSEYMRDELTSDELHYFLYAGQFLIYMQALRFLTDFLNNDVYYGAAYETHNFERSRNQLRLLHCINDKQEVLEAIIASELKRKVYGTGR